MSPIELLPNNLQDERPAIRNESLFVLSRCMRACRTLYMLTTGLEEAIEADEAGATKARV
ncbi:LOW QUALITY PROTEIN: hypothetical protein IFM46972_08461 [Aspergillus udagawae]|uniref:Uncharacterized protein n=1 Tax=Aspergillus udagawae TaxID=91492 RepID=A0A8H3P932_9EURO|nr:LOW QUALITY PROTEIN: hypothetical protein IFM46972_08461 [Aspergillus udagawae]